MTTKLAKKEQNLFHLFIQNADRVPMEATIFPYFEFMDQSIRKKFNQLKKIEQKKEKQLTCFEEFWEDLDSDDKVSMYINWTRLLNRALEIEKNGKSRQQLENECYNLSDQIYIKKTAIFTKWQKKNVKLTSTHFIILSTHHKNREFELRDYEIRKSRSRENFAWVLQPINKNGKYLQCGVSSQTMFDEWFQAVKKNINNQRIVYFYTLIKQQRENPGSVRKKYFENKKSKKDSQDSNQGPIMKKNISGLGGMNMKTLTERMIDQQMKLSDNDAYSDVEEFQDFDEQPEIKKNKEGGSQGSDDGQNQKNDKKLQETPSSLQIPSNPNIFNKLIPEYTNILNFADTPVNCVLLHCGPDYRIYQLPSKQGEQTITLKFFTILPYPKSLIFQAISSDNMAWNQQIDLETIKTKISSQNTILIYEKNKPQGILYRQRDFLYLRHCFSIVNMKQKNSFMVDKSIDSIHHPPFMTVVRAEKQLIWGLIQKQSGKECILIVQGWIKGGGYMNTLQNKEMTYKYMKKLMNLNGFLKQISFIDVDKSNLMFREDWLVDVTREEQQVGRKYSAYSESKSQKSKEEEGAYGDVEGSGERKIDKHQRQLEEFMIRTKEELANDKMQKSQVFVSDQKLQPQNYIAPPLNAEKFVIIPQKYLKIVHNLVPKQKSTKPKYFPHFRGHHLWKGEWAVLPGDGLQYVDAQKMQEQKKVLTYIIKRIGRNIFSGKGILNISLPVDIFCIESNIERIAMSFGYFPHYLQKASLIKQPQVQLKHVIASGIASSLIYLTMQKPFNPILGQTYQCWIDNCPIYFEQISHHPPIAAFMMKGRGYTVSGCVEAKMDLSINSGTGNNEGIFKVEFQNGNTFYYTTPAGCLTGLTYGDRKLNLVGKSFYWSDKGLFLEINYNPASKTKGFFGGVKGQGDQKLADYFEGYVRQYPPQAIKQICSKKGEFKQISIIPKGAPSIEPLKTHYKVCGRWNKYVNCGEQKIFDVDENRYYSLTDEKYPLPSHCNYREDIVYRRLKNFVVSQEFKEVLEIKQREDRKLRGKFVGGANNKH